MVEAEIVDFVRQYREKGQSLVSIKHALLHVGFPEQAVLAAISQMQSAPKPQDQPKPQEQNIFEQPIVRQPNLSQEGIVAPESAPQVPSQPQTHAVEQTPLTSFITQATTQSAPSSVDEPPPLPIPNQSPSNPPQPTWVAPEIPPMQVATPPTPAAYVPPPIPQMPNSNLGLDSNPAFAHAQDATSFLPSIGNETPGLPPPLYPDQPANLGFSAMPFPKIESEPVIQKKTQKTSSFGSILLIMLIIVVLIGAGVYFFMYQNSGSILTQKLDDVVITQTGSNTALAPSDGTCTAERTDCFDQEWQAYEQIIAAIDAKDIVALNSHIYEPVNLQELTEQGMSTDMFWNMFSMVMKSDNVSYTRTNFSIIAKDSKQTILSTEVVSETGSRFSRIFMFFVRDASGSTKLTGILNSGVSDRSWFVDSDSDGLSDVDEDCRGPNEFNSLCVKTNPAQKDSDSDGWWDGVETQVSKSPINATDVVY